MAVQDWTQALSRTKKKCTGAWGSDSGFMEPNWPAAQQGMRVMIGYAGLESVDLHLRRVAARVHEGGHDIPETDIRRRWIASHENLIRLLPWVTTLVVYDNSLERDPAAGAPPVPTLVLRIEERKLRYPGADDVAQTPQWAKPIVAAAYKSL